MPNKLIQLYDLDADEAQQKDLTNHFKQKGFVPEELERVYVRLIVSMVRIFFQWGDPVESMDYVFSPYIKHCVTLITEQLKRPNRNAQDVSYMAGLDDVSIKFINTFVLQTVDFRKSQTFFDRVKEMYKNSKQ